MAAAAEAKPDLIDTSELARRLGVHPITPVVWRRDEKGPPYVRLPGCKTLLYDWQNDVVPWLASGRVVPAASTDGMRWMQKRAQGGLQEQIEFDSAKHGVEVDNASIREGVRRARR